MDERKRKLFMRQALRLAAKGAAKVAPNPQVGAVLVKGGRVIGSGYHKRFGAHHAEVEAIKNCHSKGDDPAGATLFVNLEPCCHYGKTPPCTEAISKAKITHVEIATLDENVLVAGKGAKILSENGIQVSVGCCQKQARILNAGFFKHQKSAQPLVILKWAQSIDGKLAWPDKADRPWITGETARRNVHKLRSSCGAVLVGVGTVLADDPLLNVRLQRSTWQPRRVVLDSRLRIPLESQLVQTAHNTPTEIYALQQNLQRQSEKTKLLNEMGCQVIPVGDLNGHCQLQDVLTDLGKKGVTDLLVEAGPTVLRAFWDQKLADKIMVYIAPLIIGAGNDIPQINFYNELRLLNDIHIQTFDDDILIEGFLEKV